MEPERLVLLSLLVLGVLARNALIVVATGVLLVLHYLRLPWLFTVLERRATEVGLIVLLMAVLAPFAAGRVGWREIRACFTSWTGVASVLGGLLAAYMSGRGILLLEQQPQVTAGLVIGSILGVVMLRGIPVGPLAAAGFAALLLGRWR